MIDFRMPALGADMDAGTLAEWLKRPGDDLKRGDIIAVVETQKGAIEIEVFNDGKLEEIRVSEGEKVPVGTVLATIRELGAPERPQVKPAKAPKAPAPSAPSPKPPKRARAAAPAPMPAMPAERVKVTPAARRRAAERGIGIEGLAPGPDGVIGLSQVAAAVAMQRRGPAPDRAEMRKAIAAAMARANREIPHYYVSHTVEMTRLLDWLEQTNAQRPVPERLLYAAPLLRALALALKEAPTLNGHYVEDTFRPAAQVNIGVMTALRGGGGLIAPAVLGVEALSVDALMAALRDLVTRARTGRIRSSELTETTITFSNLGEDTAEEMLPIIYPPQVAIIGCGAILERAWVVGGGVAARRVLTLTVAGDHRVSDGRQAALFLKRFEALVQTPEAL